MNQDPHSRVRPARAEDFESLLALWELLFEELDSPSSAPWQANAREWFAASIDQGTTRRITVVEVDGELVGAAIGTLNIGVPDPYSPGRAVRLENVITLPAHRRRGYATELVRDLIAWAQTVVKADRIDLNATVDGQPLYEQLGFVVADAPRMKLAL